jgi:hypothetical protein
MRGDKMLHSTLLWLPYKSDLNNVEYGISEFSNPKRQQRPFVPWQTHSSSTLHANHCHLQKNEAGLP